MNKINRWVIGFTAVLVLSLWLADKAFSEKIGVITTSQAHTQAHIWVKMLKETGATAGFVTLKNVFSISGISTLVLPSDFQFPEGKEEKHLKNIQDYVKKGGKVLAVGRAGYNKGVFYLTPILRAGGSQYAYSPGGLYNYKTGRPRYDRDAFKKRAEAIMATGADGLWFYSFFHLKMPIFRPESAKKKNIPDFEDTASYVFHNVDKWKRTPSFSIPLPLGCPVTMKAMWIKDWMLHKNNGTMSVEEMVDICHKIGCNWIIFGLEGRNRGTKSFPSRIGIIPGHPEYVTALEQTVKDGKFKKGENPSPDQQDWLKRLIARAKMRGIGVWINVVVRPHLTYYKFYPEDKGIGASGKTGALCPIRISKRFFHHESRWIEEVLRKYPYISGVCLDEPAQGIYYKRNRSKWWECFCPECKQAFRDYCGKELTTDTAYASEKKRTAVYQEFLQDMHTDYVHQYSLLLHRINPEIKLAIANYLRNDNRNLYDKLADAGADVLLPEFGAGNSSMPLKWKHRVQYFEFFELKEGEGLKKIWGDAVKIKLYEGAEVEVWVSDGNYSYPGVVKANNGKTIYLSFDPTVIEYEKGKEILGKTLKDFNKKREN
jgi:hypothetical protein